MVARTSNSTYAARLGATCPACSRSELILRIDAQGLPVLACSTCKATLRPLRRHGDPMPGYEPRPAGSSEYYFDAPEAGSWWTGLIRQRDGFFRPVCWSATAAGCFDALLDFPGEGDRLLMPCDPPIGKVADQAEDAAPSRRTKS